MAAGTLEVDVLLLADSSESEDELQADASISTNAARTATKKGTRKNRYLGISPPLCD